MAAAAGVLLEMELSVNLSWLCAVDRNCVRPTQVDPRVGSPVSFLAIVGDLRDGVSTTGNSLVAALALPDTDSLALDGVLSAESADVAGVLGDFHLLHLLTQGGTVSVGKLLESVVVVEEYSAMGPCVSRKSQSCRRELGECHTWYHIYR